jgi:hypothetical protein
VANDRNDQTDISRRDFTARIGAAAAGLAVGGEYFRPLSATTASAQGRILGANDKVVLASIGIRGQGNSLKRGFAQLKNVEIKTLCDVDANLAPERINDARLKDVPAFKPTFVQDMRRVFDDKDIDGVVIATPNHWHALATLWAMQAGKHVYVEKPASHTVLEGRRMVDAAAHYKKIVQTGTMNRSRPAVRAAIKFMQDGGIGKIYMARGLCFKPRAGIGKYPDGPMQPGEKFSLTVGGTSVEPTYDAAYLSKVEYDLWIGPAPKKPFNRNRFHYNWHWQWEYGGGDTFVYGDGTILEFGTRGEHTNDEGGVRIGNLFYGSKGWLWIDESGRRWQSYMGAVGVKNEKGPGSDSPADAAAEPTGLTTIEFPHYQNWVDALRANDPKLLTCDILEGHLSSTLPHLANISYRVGRELAFDGKGERFVNDKKADAFLTREYRKGFELPKQLS